MSTVWIVLALVLLWLAFYVRYAMKKRAVVEEKVLSRQERRAKNKRKVL